MYVLCISLDCQSADENEAAAPLPHSRDENQEREGVMTRLEHNRWDRQGHVQREDGWMEHVIQKGKEKSILDLVKCGISFNLCG